MRLGVAHHFGWAVIVTALADHRVVDRRRIALASVLGGRAEEILRGPRKTLGPPWNSDHRIALATTVLAGRAPEDV